MLSIARDHITIKTPLNMKLLLTEKWQVRYICFWQFKNWGIEKLGNMPLVKVWQRACECEDSVFHLSNPLAKLQPSQNWFFFFQQLALCLTWSKHSVNFVLIKRFMFCFHVFSNYLWISVQFVTFKDWVKLYRSSYMIWIQLSYIESWTF